MIAQTLNQLKQQRAKLQIEISTLDQAIGALQKLIGPTNSADKPVKKRKMSAAAKKKIAAFQKARWAKIKAAGNK